MIPRPSLIGFRKPPIVTGFAGFTAKQWQLRPVAGTGSNDHMSLGEVTFLQELTDSTQPGGYTVTGNGLSAGSYAEAFNGLAGRFAVTNGAGAIGAKWPTAQTFKGILLRGATSFVAQYARELVIETRDLDTDPWVEVCRLYARAFTISEIRKFSLQGQAETGGSRYWRFAPSLNYNNLTDQATMAELEGYDITNVENIIRDFKSVTFAPSTGGSPQTTWFNSVFGTEAGRITSLPGSMILDMGVPRKFANWRGTSSNVTPGYLNFPKAFTIDKSSDNVSYSNVYTQTSGTAPSLTQGETKTWSF